MMECIEKVGVYRPAVPGLATGMWLEMFAGVKEQMGLFQDLYVALIANKVTAGRKCISNLLRGLPASDSAADIVRLAAWPEQL
jgi:ethanolamine ammonia-lyase small subunit